MKFTNRTTRLLSKFDFLPKQLSNFVISVAMGKVIRFIGTAGIRVEDITPSRVCLRLPNRKKVRNHLGGIHASAVGLLAEATTGFLIFMNIPDNKIPVLKSQQIDYLKQAKGALKAVASLSPEQQETLRKAEKGDLSVAVYVTDEAGQEPVACEMTWAWMPLRKDAVSRHRGADQFSGLKQRR